MIDEHIFLKELVAAKDPVLRVMTKYGKNCHIRLGVDNSATYHALWRMYSANEAAIPHIIELRNALRTHNCLLTVILLRSEQNAADAASRGRLSTDTERLTCLSALCRA